MAYEEARAERDFRQNPPSNAPGQDPFDDWDSIPLGSSSVEDISQSNDTTNINDTLNNINTNVGNNTNPNNQQNPQGYAKSGEEVLFDTVVIAGKGVFKYLKFFVQSLTNNTPSDWHALGVQICKCSVGFFFVGCFFLILDIFRKSGNHPIDLMIGSLMATIPGLVLCSHFDANPTPESEVNNEEENFNNNSNFDNDFDFGSSSLFDEEEGLGDNNDFNFSDDSFSESDSESSEDDDDSIWDEYLNDDSDFFEDFSNDSSSIESNDFSVSEALESVPEITPGTQTRQYLFETFCKVLPTMNPGFAKMNSISTESDDFYYFEDLLRSAAYQVGTKEENIPELVSVYENPFIYRLNCTRPAGLKEQLIADEIASTYSRDDNNMEYLTGVYATIETAVNVYTINLFKGMLLDPKQQKPITISLGDVYKEISDYIKDPSVQMPFVWGINELGKTLYCDVIDTNSIIISGEPRGGKSWKGQSIIAQLAMFNSPKEIEFYFFDTKNNASDYRHLSEVLPHAKYFCGDPLKVNKGIERVLDKAVEERGKIITNAGCINIKDYNKKFPDNKLPYMYIVIDELMGLMEFFNTNDMKDEATKFKGYLSTMVSKLAYAGVRFILFPHRIVDSVIAKNTYSLVSCRAIVNQLNEDDLKSAIGVTKKTFPYSLAQKGDMAVVSKEISGGKASFCHAEILSSSNESNEKLFDFIGSVWKRLEPDCGCITFTGSIGGRIDINKPYSDFNSSTPVLARDNTNGAKEYEYNGFSEEPTNGGFSGIESLGELDNTGEQVDESYWDQLLL